MTDPIAVASGAGSAVVIILKKTQGSVWRESGRTELCPTAAWLHEHYGPGEYELRLKLGSRVLTNVNALVPQSAAVVSQPGPASQTQARAMVTGSVVARLPLIARVAQ